VPVRVRFAPSPTGSLHLGNALTAVANRRFADANGGVLVLRIDDTDRTRTVAGGEEAILGDLAWLDIEFDEGPVRQSERGDATRQRTRARGGGASATTTARCGSPAPAPRSCGRRQRDLSARLRRRRSRARDHTCHPRIGPPAERRGQQRIARALGGELPEVIHHGLVLGADGKKLSKRHGHSSIAELREEGFPPAACARISTSSISEHDVRLDLARLRRLAVDAIAAMPDESSRPRRGARRGRSGASRARSLVEAREYAQLVLDPQPTALGEDARPTLERFGELRTLAPERLSLDEGKAIVRELKAVGGDLHVLRVALTGTDRGPELGAVLAALSRDEALVRTA
jgi:hypothetical protein